MIPDCEDAVPSGATSPTNSTLWAMPPVFLHSTVSPALIVSAFGMNSAGASLMTITAAGSWRPPGPAVTGLLPDRHPKPATVIATATAARTRCILGVIPIIVRPPWSNQGSCTSGVPRRKRPDAGLKAKALRLLPPLGSELSDPFSEMEPGLVALGKLVAHPELAREFVHGGGRSKREPGLEPFSLAQFAPGLTVAA